MFKYYITRLMLDIIKDAAHNEAYRTNREGWMNGSVKEGRVGESVTEGKNRRIYGRMSQTDKGIENEQGQSKPIKAHRKYSPTHACDEKHHDEHPQDM